MMIDELYQQYHKDVYCYIYSLCHNQTLSEDLTSETFYQVMLSLPSFKGKSHIKTWIFSIARHTTYKELKKRKIEVSTDILPDIPFIQDYSYHFEDIMELIKDQPETYQQVFRVRIEGYAFEEIAEILELNANSVRVIYHRMKKHLKDILERGDYFE